MTVTIRDELRPRLIDYCRSVYPEEACGFVIGDADQAAGSMTASEFVPVRNVAAAPDREFEMDPAELAVLLAETPLSRLLGIFHSHPRSAPVPSAADLLTDWYTLPSYWIVSLLDRSAPSLAVYRLERRGGAAVPLALAVRDKKEDRA